MVDAWQLKLQLNEEFAKKCSEFYYFHGEMYSEKYVDYMGNKNFRHKTRYTHYKPIEEYYAPKSKFSFYVEGEGEEFEENYDRYYNDIIDRVVEEGYQVQCGYVSSWMLRLPMVVGTVPSYYNTSGVQEETSYIFYVEYGGWPKTLFPHPPTQCFVTMAVKLYRQRAHYLLRNCD